MLIIYYNGEIYTEEEWRDFVSENFAQLFEDDFRYYLKDYHDIYCLADIWYLYNKGNISAEFFYRAWEAFLDWSYSDSTTINITKREIDLPT